MKFVSILGIILIIVILGALMGKAITNFSETVTNDPSSQLIIYPKGFLWVIVLGIIGVGLVMAKLRSGKGPGR